MTQLTHLDEAGQARMVDVGAKEATQRTAVAEGFIAMTAETLKLALSGDAKKGDVLAAARIAGIMAAKKTSELIPLCHVVALTKVEIDIRLEGGTAIIDASAEAKDRTGVEMEALVAASTAALTLYDMLKSVDRGMAFDVALVSKTGGKSGDWERPDDETEDEG
jgi:cyclic pyranopterin phosphate synthase